MSASGNLKNINDNVTRLIPLNSVHVLRNYKKKKFN